MAFAVRLYNFSKKRNSTAVPASGATYSQYNCTNKGVLDILRPIIVLKFTNDAEADTSNFIHKNYAYIPSFGRYYYVSGWSNSGPLWEATLEVDALASFRAKIGASTLYVYRSSTSYNNRLPDSIYPQLASPRRLTINAPKVWTVGGANSEGGSANEVTIIAGIIGGNSTRFYAMTTTNWTRFFSKLFSSDYYTDVLGEFGATEYPEAKVAINPLQFISSCVQVPLSISTGVRYCVDYVSAVTSIPVGNVAVTPQSGFTAYYLGDATDLWSASISLGSDFWHPQADDRGDWLNYAPATEYLFFFPPIGEIPLEASLIDGADSLSWTIRVDYKANKGLLEVLSNFTSPARSYPLFRGEFSLGVSVQLCNVLTTGTAYKGAEDIRTGWTGIAADIAKFAADAPIIGGTVSRGIQSAIHGATPKLTLTGSFASLASMGGQPRLIVTHWLYANDDLDGKGRPLCDMRQLSNIPGYIMAEADELSISGAMAPEIEEIRTAVNSGFFYE